MSSSDAAHPAAAGKGTGAGRKVQLVGSWILVGVPLGYGVVQTLSRAAALFG